MKKYIVICGPELVPGNKEFREAVDMTYQDALTAWGDVEIIRFPEMSRGAQQTRDLVNRIVEKSSPTIIVTRYDAAVSEFANLCADGKVDRDELLFILVRYHFGGKEQYSYHQMSEDNQYLSNPWPMGVLW